jgi:hypothetical protein
MTIDKLNKYIGKKLLNVISLDTKSDLIKRELKAITNNNYSDVNSAKMLIFEEGMALVFIDFDCDGYRSGDWNLINVENVLDKGSTEGIKTINSEVVNIEFKNVNDKDYCLITTRDYLICMGQDNSDSYYPSNFFNIEECKNFALGSNVELVK